jgi:hypothetical protein
MFKQAVANLAQILEGQIKLKAILTWSQPLTAVLTNEVNLILTLE